MATTAHTAKPIKHHCDCGRGFTTSSGIRNHQLACPIERARSAAYVEALENGREPWAAGRAAVQEALAAR